MAIELLHLDRDLAVFLKPPGILAEPTAEGGDVFSLLRQETGREWLPVHRLDRGTGGLMAAAGSRESAAALSRSILEHTFQKAYLTVVQGTAPFADALMEDLLFHDRVKNKVYVVQRPRKGVKEALAFARVLAEAKDGGEPLRLMAVTLYTGRTHQIRVQLASRRMPILGDGKYGSSRPGTPALWCAALTLPHPKSGKSLSFSALPPDEAPWNLFDRALMAITPESRSLKNEL